MTANAAAAVVIEIRRPPSAGPTLRARLKAMVLSEIACGRSRGPTVLRTDACHAGALIAVPVPTPRVMTNSSAGVIAPAWVRSASTLEIASIPHCAASITRRRSKLSAIAPANTPNSMIGIVAEACTSAIRTWLRVSSVISHAAPTDWIIEPMLEVRLAIQIARKAG